MKKFSIWDNTGKQTIISADSGVATRTPKGLKIVFKAGRKTIKPKGHYVGFIEVSPPIVFVQVPENDEDSLGGGKGQDEE
jgi:hypothetical protein